MLCLIKAIELSDNVLVVNKGKFMQIKQRNYFQSLESLRGIAALIVVLYHVGWMYPLYDIGFIRNGALMVDLFFVLSGFVMVHCYREYFFENNGLLKFLKARFWRLYPLHLLMLFVFLGIELIKYVAELKFGIVSGSPAFVKSNWESFSYQIFLLHSLVQEHGSFNSPSWSISTEFYTYIVFAFIMINVRKYNLLPLIFIGVAGVSLFIILNNGHDSLTFDYQDSIFRCFYGFFIGAFTYEVYQKTLNRPFIKNNFIGSICFIFIFIISIYILGIKHDNYIEFLTPFLFSFLILTLVFFPKNACHKALCWMPFQWLGKVSYSIYMIHMAYIWVFSAALQAVMKVPKGTVDGDEVIMTSMLFGSIVTFLLIICILGTSYFTFKYIEDPFRKFAKRVK